MRALKVVLSIIIYEATLILYIFMLYSKASVFVDLWPLNNIAIETGIVIVILSISAWFIFLREIASIILVGISILVLIVVIPIIKYPNNLMLYGPGDPAAHYSFASWIISQGFIPSDNQLYYSIQYGYHPGNGLLPAFLHILTGSQVLLTVSMYFILSLSYIIYFILIVITIKKLQIGLSNKFLSYIFKLSLILLFTYFPPYFVGIDISYFFIGMIIFVIINVINKPTNYSYLYLILISYMGLFLTNYSTAVILLIYFLIIQISLLFKKYKFNRINTNLLKFSVITCSIIFTTYEFYFDVLLSSSTIYSSFLIIKNLYISEFESASRSIKYGRVTIYDLGLYALGSYTKYAILLMGSLIYLLIIIFSKSQKRNVNSFLNLLFISTLPLWIVGWAGVGDLAAIGRAQAIVQFILTVNILMVLTKLFLNNKRKLRKSVLVFSLLITTIFGFITNFGLPLTAHIQTSEDERYSFPIFSQGAITEWSLSPVVYMNEFLSQQGPSLLCIQPYIYFGLCDLLWDKPKIPEHGFLFLPVTNSSGMINLINSYSGVIIPIPLNDKTVVGPIGYTSIFKKPYSYLIYNSNAKVYDNGYYNLFVKY